MKNYASLLSDLPFFGSRVLCSARPLEKAFLIQKIQIYKDMGKLFFKDILEDDIYFCIGKVMETDEITAMENMVKVLVRLNYKIENGKIKKEFE